MASNGQLPASALSVIPGGRLEHNAAGWWNAGPARAGLRPAGPNSTYRPLPVQRYFWALWQAGKGNLAAFPGTSNHGWGKAVDLAARWMRAWMDAHGAAYHWAKTEAFNEWWHENFTGSAAPAPKPNPLKPLSGSEHHHASSLIYRRARYTQEAKSGKGRKYRFWYALAKRENAWIRRHMGALNRDAHTHGKGGWTKNNRGARYQILGRVLDGKIK